MRAAAQRRCRSAAASGARRCARAATACAQSRQPARARRALPAPRSSRSSSDNRDRASRPAARAVAQEVLGASGDRAVGWRDGRDAVARIAYGRSRRACDSGRWPSSRRSLRVGRVMALTASGEDGAAADGGIGKPGGISAVEDGDAGDALILSGPDAGDRHPDGLDLVFDESLHLARASRWTCRARRRRRLVEVAPVAGAAWVITDRPQVARQAARIDRVDAGPSRGWAPAKERPHALRGRKSPSSSPRRCAASRRWRRSRGAGSWAP